MDSLLKDVGYALRGLRRNPAFALLAIVTLALGIGANTAIFSVVHGAVLKPLPYPEPQRLVFITSQFPALGFDEFWVSPPEFVEFRQNNKAFVSVGAYTVTAANLGVDHPVRPVTAIVSDDLFPTLGVTPLRGRGFTHADTLPAAEGVAVLSYGLWQSAFGGTDAALGRLVEVDGAKTRIVGIMPAGVDVHDQKVELWLPLTLEPNPANRSNHFLYLIGRLRGGVTLQKARTDLDRLLKNWPNAGGGRHQPNATTHRLRFDPLQDDIVGNAKTAAWILQAAVAFVLLIACANLASLLLARAESRQREFALRAALGAGTLRLVRQFVAEGIVLSLAGGAAGVALAVAGLRALIAANPGGIPRTSEIAVDGTVLVFTLAVAVACGIVFGFVPLLRFSRAQIHGMLKEAGSRLTAGRTHRHARNTLVVAEIALAVVLVVGAGLMVRTFWNLMRVDAGFDRSHMVTFQIVLPGSVYKPAEAPAFFDRLLDRLSHVPGVHTAAAMNGLPPLRDVNANDTDFEDISPAQRGQEGVPPENVDYWQGVSVNYVQTMGVPVVEGRSFEPTDIEGGPVVLVNQTLAKVFFPNRSPIGRRLKTGFGDKLPWFTIVGVLKDVKQGGVGSKTGTELYLLNDQLPRLVQFAYSDMNIVLRTSLGPAALAPTIQGIVRGMDPSLPVVRLRSMEDVFVESVSRPRFLALLLGIFAGLALLLAAVGAYGVLSYLVTERRQEIGVRMALGASRSAVLGMILRQGLVLTGIGLAIGIAGALVLTRLLGSLLFGVGPADPLALAAGGAFMTAVAVVACLIPARRATRVDPIVVLRAE
jgi:putative ABC transport system permease protein